MASVGDTPPVGDTPQFDPPVIRVVNLDKVCWEDVQLDEEGNAIGVFDSEFNDFSSKQLRTICSRLNLRGLKNAKKQEMIDSLIQAYGNPNGTAPKKRKRDESEIAMDIRDFGNSQMSVELAKQKLLQYMQREDVRREAEHRQRKEEHQQQKRKTLFEEWEKVQSNIRLLRKDIRDITIDDATRRELQEDIDGLVKRKNDLASKLGLK